MTERLRVTVYDGKYSVIQTDDGLRALRHGEEWRNLVGDGLVLALAQEVELLREQLEASKQVAIEWERDMKGTLATLETVKASNEKLLETLKELALCDGSPSNVVNADVLAKRVRSFAKKAIVAATGKEAYAAGEVESPIIQTYRFRAECWPDVEELLKKIVSSTKRVSFTIEPPFPDVKATLETTMSLVDLRAVMLQIEDGHVMAETVAQSREYTGERRRAA